MKAYEMLYIIEAGLSDENKEELISKVQGMIERNGGKNVQVEKWGVRKFAYPINYKNEGFYVLANFEAPETAIVSLDRQMLITDGIVRQMIIAKVK